LIKLSSTLTRRPPVGWSLKLCAKFYRLTSVNVFIAVFNNVGELPFSSKIKISVKIELARHTSVKTGRIGIILSVLESHELRLQEYVKIFIGFQISEKSADVSSNSTIHHAAQQYWAF